MSAAPVVRRTQAQRRAASRQQLLDAAVDCLADVGYAGTTIPEVLRRAGLSNGAMWRHFPSKLDLLVAATQEIDLLPDDDALDALRSTPPAQRLDRVIDQLWTLTSSKTFQASVELIRASRADAALRDALVALDSAAAERFFGAMRTMLGPDFERSPHFERDARFLALALYGVAVTECLRGREAPRRLREELKHVARALFLTG